MIPHAVKTNETLKDPQTENSKKPKLKYMYQKSQTWISKIPKLKSQKVPTELKKPQGGVRIKTPQDETLKIPKLKYVYISKSPKLK